MQRPERFERGLATGLEKFLAEECGERRRRTDGDRVGEHSQGGLTLPAIVAAQTGERRSETPGGGGRSRRGGRWRLVRFRRHGRAEGDLCAGTASLRLESVDSAGTFVDAALVVAGVIDPLLVQVGDVQSAIGARLDIDGPKPRVGGGQDVAEIAGLERRTVGLEIAKDHSALQRFNAEQLAMVSGRQRRFFVNDEGMGETRHAMVGHLRKIAERIGIAERAMLTEPLLEIAPLNVMKTAGVAAVMARVDAALGVDFDAERVAAAFGEDFVNPPPRMVPPYQLPHRMDGRLLRAWAFHIAADRAALASVQPAIRAPTQTIGDRMGIFEPKPFEMHFRIAIGLIVAVAVGIEQ